MTSEQLAELQTELLTDPDAYGYAPHIAAGNMQPLADLLNIPRGDEDMLPNEAVSYLSLQQALFVSEYQALTATRQELWNAYTREDIDLVAAPEMKTQIEELFGFTGSTYNSLQSVWMRQASHAEELWGVKTVVAWQDCAAALALP